MLYKKKRICVLLALACFVRMKVPNSESSLVSTDNHHLITNSRRDFAIMTL